MKFYLVLPNLISFPIPKQIELQKANNCTCKADKSNMGSVEKVDTDMDLRRNSWKSIQQRKVGFGLFEPGQLEQVWQVSLE